VLLCSRVLGSPKHHAAGIGNIAGQGRGSEISLLILFLTLIMVAATTDLPIRSIILNYSVHVRGGD
jgi:hypothetical protein